MGLDMGAWTTKKDIPEVDCDEPDDGVLIHQWRKHPHLHGWMESLYRAKGGTEEDFNQVGLRLDAADLNALEQAVRQRGFFFGESDGSEMADDLRFIEKARKAIQEGKKVIYAAWW